MRAALALLPLLAGCATIPGENHYVARGSEPDWDLSIGSTLITMSVGRTEHDQGGSIERFRFPRVAPVRAGDRYIWTSTSRRGETIVVEAEFVPQSPCAQRGADTVRVVVNGREYRGCGGQEIRVTGS